MHSSDLLSKEWCDIVFENRNREYGAYHIRRQAGHRYRLALTVVVGVFVLMVLVYAGLSAYLYDRLSRQVKEAEKALAELRRSELKEGYKVHFVATARMRPVQRMAPGASSGVPEIVSGPVKPTVLGIKGKFTFDADQAVITSPIVDTTGLSREDLPIANEKIVPTEVVQAMPEFPGGARVFMRWLDQHIGYPSLCISARKEGDVTLTFIVGKDGYACEMELHNAFDPLIERAVKRAFDRMPKWKPGTDSQGQPTPVRVTVPIRYRL